MNIVKATKNYEDWLRQHIRIVEPDLQFKHEQMAAALFPFFRATFYRWVAGLARGLPRTRPRAASSFGRRPARGELRHLARYRWPAVWGVNDFDEACCFPTPWIWCGSPPALCWRRATEHLTMKPKDAAAAILEGYERGMEEGGRPFVLGEEP